MPNKIKPKNQASVSSPAARAAAKPAKASAVSPAAPKAAGKPASSMAAPKAAVATTRPDAPVVPTGVPANPRDMAIVCPVLGSLIAEGKVKMDAEGNVKIADLRKTFGDDLGFSADHQRRAAGVGVVANKPIDVLKNAVTQEFNVLDMRAGIIKHQGDSAILTEGQFDQGKFDAFVSHANKDGVMNEDSFAKAIAANYVRDNTGKQRPATQGKDTASGEYGALLAVFGTKDPATGQLGIKVDDLKLMFKDKQLPPSQRATANKDIDKMKKTILGKADAYLANGAFRSTATATGMAEAGSRLIDGKPEAASAQASVSAGKAAACPHMNGAAKMPTNQAEILTQHSPAT